MIHIFFFSFCHKMSLNFTIFTVYAQTSPIDRSVQLQDLFWTLCLCLLMLLIQERKLFKHPFPQASGCMCICISWLCHIQGYHCLLENVVALVSRGDAFSVFLQIHLLKEDIKGLQEKFLKEMVNKFILSSFLFIYCGLNTKLLKF